MTKMTYHFNNGTEFTAEGPTHNANVRSAITEALNSRFQFIWAGEDVVINKDELNWIEIK